MDVRNLIELAAGATIPLVLIAVIIRSIWQKKGIGARIIQFTAVGMLVPSVLILGLEKILDPATIGTLIGGLIGYVLSGVGDYKRSAEE